MLLSQLAAVDFYTTPRVRCTGYATAVELSMYQFDLNEHFSPFEPSSAAIKVGV